MQRSLINQKPLVLFWYIVFFAIYESLSSIYLFLPPMLGVLYLFFSRALKEENTLYIVLVSFLLILFEAEKGYLIFSTIIFFTIMYKFIMPKLIQNFSCNSCIKLSTVLLAYLGFYVYSIVISNIFLLPIPSIDYYIVYYIVIEFLIVSIL